MAEEWVISNLNVVPSPAVDNELAIYWGDESYTDLKVFIEMFGSVINEALASKTDVRKAISENDNGRGYADVILN